MIAVDVTRAIVLTRFLRHCKFWFGVTLLTCSAGFVIYRGSIWLIVLITVAAAYAVVQYPRRALLTAMTCLLPPVTTALATYSLWRFSDFGASDVTIGIILLPAGIVTIALYCFWRALNQASYNYRDAVTIATGEQPALLST